MELRETAVKVNVERAIEYITKAAKSGAFSVDFSKEPELKGLGHQPIIITEEMHEEIQAAFTSKLTFDGDVVSW